MYYSRKTIYQGLLEQARMKETIHDISPDFTLNKYWQVHEDVIPNLDTSGNPEYPKQKYLAIGRGGHVNAIGQGNASLTDIKEHTADNARLFEHLPFICRPLDDDLSPAERSRYRMRVVREIDGVLYAFYYLMVVNFVSEDPVAQILTTSNGVTTPTEYNPSPSLLNNPQALPMENGEVIRTSGRVLSVQSPLVVELSETDINEIIDACEILYKDPRYATISEVAFVQAYDRTVTSADGVSYVEALAAQPSHFMGDYSPLTRGIPSLTFSYLVGSTYPDFL